MLRWVMFVSFVDKIQLSCVQALPWPRAWNNWPGVPLLEALDAADICILQVDITKFGYYNR